MTRHSCRACILVGIRTPPLEYSLGGKQGQHPGVQFALRGKHPFRQGGHVVTRQDRNLLLPENAAVVVFVIHQMHCATGLGIPRRQDSLVNPVPVEPLTTVLGQ